MVSKILYPCEAESHKPSQADIFPAKLFSVFKLLCTKKKLFACFNLLFLPVIFFVVCINPACPPSQGPLSVQSLRFCPKLIYASPVHKLSESLGQKQVILSFRQLLCATQTPTFCPLKDMGMSLTESFG